MKLTWSHLLLLILPLFTGCDIGETPEPDLIIMEDPVVEITELTTNRIKLRWDEVEHAEHYQLNVYLIPYAEEVLFMNYITENEVEFEHNFCRDSVSIVLFASAGDKTGYYSSRSELRFKVPPCEFELTFRESTAPPYCGQAPLFNGFWVDIRNVTHGYYEGAYDFFDPGLGGDLSVELTSNIAQYDPASPGPYFAPGSGNGHRIGLPYIQPSLCDDNPATDIISIDFSVKYSETDKHIPGSPMQFKVAIN